MIKIIQYQINWPTEFQAIAWFIRRGLGKLAIRIDHIGSTAVPGLAAKDIIDLQITVQSLSEPVIKGLIDLGYEQYEEVCRDHCPPGFDELESEWEKLLFKPPTGQRPTHIHVRAAGRANQRYALLFRDYLCTHPATAGAYAELKHRLVEHLADPQTYPEVKDPAVDLIYLAAEEWAERKGWQPRASDA